MLVWEVFSSRKLLSHGLYHSWWLYKCVEQPRVPLAINTPVLWAEPCGVEVFCRVRALFLQMIKEALGQSPLKNGRFHWEMSSPICCSTVLQRLQREESAGQGNNSLTSLSEMEWGKPIPQDFRILSKLYLLSGQLLECWSSSKIDGAGWKLRLWLHLASKWGE